MEKHLNPGAFLLGVVFCFSVCNAQPQPGPLHSALVSLRENEKAFAQLCAQRGIRIAFTHYMDDQSITFSRGKAFKGRQRYEEIATNDDLLTWQPVFSDIAASANFGYNTGPWQYRKNKNDSAGVAYGDFVSVWQRKGSSGWKMMIDLGAPHPPPRGQDTVWQTSAIETANQTASSKGNVAALLAQENDFIAAFARTGISAYGPVLSAEARFYRAGVMPAIQPAAVQNLLRLQEVSEMVIYTLAEAYIAESGDMGFVYGSVSVSPKSTAQTATRAASYLRIWKKERDVHWKIVVDVIGLN
jgi:ketosteroid isomerase-like protein